MCYILYKKDSEQGTSCVTEYMISYFAWDISKELVTSYENAYEVKLLYFLQ
jgi:hypothetical protein